MFFHVNVAGVRRHIGVLQREESEISSLLDALCRWQNEAILEGVDDISGIMNQISKVSQSRTWINNRIRFLEDLIQNTVSINNTIKMRLDELL